MNLMGPYNLNYDIIISNIMMKINVVTDSPELNYLASIVLWVDLYIGAAQLKWRSF